VTTTTCTHCGTTILPHRACTTCGYYKGIQVLATRDRSAQAPDAE
jgi:large subunit ribosomal protein L32